MGFTQWGINVQGVKYDNQELEEAYALPSIGTIFQKGLGVMKFREFLQFR
jgi:hypothetical protein